MTDRPRKRSLTLRGHATSVSLEDEFWQAFRQIAAREGRSVSALAAELDTARLHDAAGIPATGLATAIRLHVLRDYQRRELEARDAQRGIGAHGG